MKRVIGLKQQPSITSWCLLNCQTLMKKTYLKRFERICLIDCAQSFPRNSSCFFQAGGRFYGRYLCFGAFGVTQLRERVLKLLNCSLQLGLLWNPTRRVGLCERLSSYQQKAPLYGGAPKNACPNLSPGMIIPAQIASKPLPTKVVILLGYTPHSPHQLGLRWDLTGRVPLKTLLKLFFAKSYGKSLHLGAYGATQVLEHVQNARYILQFGLLWNPARRVALCKRLSF